MATTPLDIKSILDSVDAPREAKAAAWDAFHGASSPDDFRSRFDAIALPREAKAALWDSKFSTPAPGQTTPAASPQSPAVAPADPASSGAGVGQVPFGEQLANKVVLKPGFTQLMEKFPELKQFMFSNAMTSAGLKNATDLYDAVSGGAADVVSRALGVPKSTLDQNFSPIPGLISGANEVARTVPELVDFAMTPGGALAMIGPKTPKAGPYIGPAIGAGFTMDMAPQVLPAIEEARKNPTPENLAKAGKAVLFTLAPSIHAAGEMKSAGPRPVRVAPDTPAEAKASQAALATNEDLAIARVDPAQASKLVNQEIARRQAAGQWDASLEKTPSPEERRATKKAQRVTVPEEGDPDPVLTYQRGNVAAELAGKPYEQLEPEERRVVDNLVKQGYGMREAEQPAPGVDSGADPVPTVPERSSVGVPAGSPEPAVREVPATDGNPTGAKAALTPEQILARVEEQNAISRERGLREDAQTRLDELTLDDATKSRPDVSLAPDGAIRENRPPTFQEAQAARRAERLPAEPVPLLDQVADSTESGPREFMRRLDETGKEASARLRKRLSSTSSANEFLNPETIRDMAQSIAGDVARGALKAADIGRHLSKTYGPKARAVAAKVWEEAQRIVNPVGPDEFHRSQAGRRGTREVDETGDLVRGDKKIFSAALPKGHRGGAALAAEAEDAVKATRARHPVRDGWSPIEVNKAKLIPGKTPKLEVEFKTQAYKFDAPVGKDRLWKVNDITPKGLEVASKMADQIVAEVEGMRKLADEAAGVKEGDRTLDQTTAMKVMGQKDWYNTTREVFRSAYGSATDKFSELIGTTSAQTPVRTNFLQSMEALELFTKGNYEKILADYAKYRQEGGSAQKYQGELALRPGGKKYNANTMSVMDALVDMWLGKEGAPKTQTYAGNTVGRTDRATIDVWASRTLQRVRNSLLGDTPRIPPVAEVGVNGKVIGYDADGPVTQGQYRFGQEVFNQAAEKLKMKPHELQALLWFMEKDLWTQKGWTSAVGEGGDLAAQVRGANLGRLTVGIAAQDSRYMESAPNVLAPMTDAAKQMKSVVSVVNTPAIGLWKDDAGQIVREYSSGWEATIRNGGETAISDANEIVRSVMKTAARENQDAAFVARSLPPSEANNEYARPGLTIYFKDAIEPGAVDAVVAGVSTDNIGGYTAFTEPFGPSKGKIRGIRFIWMPEFFLGGAEEAQIQASFAATISDIVRIKDQISGNQNVGSSVIEFWDAVVGRRGNYERTAKETGTGGAGFDSAGADGPWKRPIGAAIARYAESSGATGGGTAPERGGGDVSTGGRNAEKSSVKPVSERRRKTQRGSFTVGPTLNDPAAEASGAAPPKKTATAEAPAPPADGAIPVSPSYEQTKGRILDKAGVSEEAKAALLSGMRQWEANNPDRKKITHAEISDAAKKTDPTLLLDQDRKTAQETVIKDPALYHAARQLVVTLSDQAAQLSEQIRTATKDTDTLELERRRDIAERDMQQMLGITLGVRSQHGRNLAMHRMMVDKRGFDDTYWASRAKKSLGLPADASLPTDVQRDLNGAMAEGRAAEAKAEAEIKAKRKAKEAAAAAGTPTAKHKEARGETKKELNRLEMVEKKRKEIIARLKASLLDPKQGNDPVMPEEYAAFEKDPDIIQLRGAIAVKRAMAQLERDNKPEFENRQAAIDDAKKKLVKRLESVLRGEKSTTNPVSPEERLAFESDPAVQKLRQKIEEKRQREKVPVTSGMRVEKGVERRLSSIEEKMNPQPATAPSEWSLTTEERKLVDADPRVQAARRDLARKMAKLEQTTLLEAISSIRRAGLLTSPRTHMRNFLGNASMQALEETSRVPGAMLDIGLSLFSGQRTYAGASGKAVARATAAAATRGVQEARQVMRQGATDEQLAQFDMPKEMNLGGGRVSRILETYTNTVFRSMSAADRVFKRYAIQRSLEEQMKLAKVDTPTEAMMAQAIADADFATFNNENKVATMYSRAKAGATPGVRFAMDMAVPFVRTPANVLARVLDYSGGGLVKAGITGAQAAIAKAMTPEQQRYIAANFGRGVTGPALIYMGYQLAAAGLATGSYQADAGKRNADEAAGRLAGAVKIGDTWQMVSPLSPGGALITIGATLQREATGPIRDEAKRPGKLAAVVGRTVLDHPFLQGAKDIADAVTSPAQQGERALAGMAGSFVPSIASDAASLGDNVRRDSRTDGGFVGAAGAAMAARTPGARNTLPERKDVLGRKLPQSGAAVVNPGIGSQAKEDSDPIIREIIRNKVAISEPQRAKDETLDQFRMRREILGREIEKQLGREIATPRYKRLDNEEERRATLDKAEKRARLLVAAKLGKRYAAADAAARHRMLTELLKAPQ